MVYILSAILGGVVAVSVILFAVYELRPKPNNNALGRGYLLCPFLFFALLLVMFLVLPQDANDNMMLTISLTAIAVIALIGVYSYKGVKRLGGLRGCKNGWDKTLLVTNVIVFSPIWLVTIIIQLFNGEFCA